MSRRREGNLFIGRLSKSVRVRDLEDVFEPYGRMSRCEVKYAYGFVDYEDQRDAEDALRYENGRELCGSNIRVEWSKGAPRGPGGGPPPRGVSLGLDPGTGKDPEVGVETGEGTDLGLAAETERELIVTTRVLHDLNQGLQVDQRADLYQNLKVAQEVRKMT
ncbi:hypothetical protein KUTeg_022862 [Tegillarca granosa]|uniref:RRM domain-containing protein n=1 Tax=Tegillarca granosa TaxID=220873 RepID=A0ABQ9E4K1_TEGGR|nr:hypothetical protein KUTeg_022862 [Tegillarca granosa]